MWRTRGPEQGLFGSALANLGDFNKDGIDDLVVGAWRLSDPITKVSSGGVYIVLMNEDGTFKKTTRISQSSGIPLLYNSFFGDSVSVLGDVNDDKITDIAVGAWGTLNAGEYRRGAVYALMLNPDGSLLNWSLLYYGNPGSRVEKEITTLDDPDKNGIPDLAVGSKSILHLTRETPDFSDAPESYSVASHTTDPNIFLGGFVDGEPSANPGVTATGDDTLGGFSSDEDGLVDPQRDLILSAGKFPTMELRVSNTTGIVAMLYGWIDLDQNGLFDLSERASIIVPDGTRGDEVKLTFPQVPNGFSGTTYARFRLSTDAAAADPSGAASDGEVEDFIIAIPDTDYGDAPDTGSGTGPGNYNTLSSDSGPAHTINTNIFMGTRIDGEFEATASSPGTADDIAGDDEDGVVNPLADLTLTTGQQPVVEVKVTNLTDADAVLYGWIDTNGDGLFDNTNERTSIEVLKGTNGETKVLVFPDVPEGFSDKTYARFRLSTDDTSADPTGLASDGEVEDYAVTILNQDFSDAPVSYSMVETVNFAPSHSYDSRIYLGQYIDLELNAFPSVEANRDDLAGSATADDEDGLVDPINALDLTPGVKPKVDVIVTNDTGLPATLYGWIDGIFDGNINGVFDPDELVSVPVPDGTLGGVVSLTFPAEVPVGLTGTSYARFRLTTDGTASAPIAPTGSASDGEVEDYLVNIVNLDYGDAPNTYKTLASDDGPVHQIDLGIFLGSGVDSEADGNPSVSANGDNEDGLTYASVDLKLTVDDYPAVRFYVTNKPPLSATLYGWIDFNMNGVFEENEKAQKDISGNTINGEGVLYFPNQVSSEFIGTTYARFRLTTDDNVLPTGPASNGEVEDYVVTIAESDDGTILPSAETSILDSFKIESGTENLSPLSIYDYFGSAMAVADLNNDGVMDYVVGAPGSNKSGDEGEYDTGAIHVLFMNNDGTIKKSVEIASGTENLSSLKKGDSFGSSVAIEDLNGDEVLDLVVGATGNNGSVHLIFMDNYGSDSNNPNATIMKSFKIDTETDNLSPMDSNASFGSSVSVADLNNDGAMDLIVGAMTDDRYQSNPPRGTIQVLFMNSFGNDSKNPIVSIKKSVKIASGMEGLGTLPPMSRFGWSIGVGDLNNDGVADLVIGAVGGSYLPYRSSRTQYVMGAVYVLFMESYGSDPDNPMVDIQERFKITSGTENLSPLARNDYFGSAVAVGDLDNDGLMDLVVGARQDDTEGSNRGAVHLLLMNDDRTINKDIKIASGTENLNPLSNGDYFGSSVVIGGLNNDGLMNLAVGARKDSTDVLSNSGAVHVLLIETKTTPETIEGTVDALPETPPEGGFQIESTAETDNINEWILAIGGDGTTENPGLPEFPRPNEVVTITLNLDEGDYTGLDVTVPSGYQLVINGEDGSVVFTGASPALTVTC